MSDYLINSAALYFGFEAPRRVPILWLTRTIDFLSSQGVTLDYFDITTTETFSSDEVYSFVDHRVNLFRVMDRGLAESIGLYSNPDVNAPKSSWQAMASIEMDEGVVFVGIDETKLSPHTVLLHAAYHLGGDMLGVKYGISYKRLRSKGPECYASGVMQGSLVDIKNWLASPQSDREPLAAWLDEIGGSRRYLTGLFRRAYPASIISAEHLAALRRCAPSGRIPGKITSLVENRLWIWELTDNEITEAEELLREGTLLVK